MGFMSPRSPGPDPELEKQRAAEEERLKAERQAEERRKEDAERKRKANLVGQRSLQDEEIGGFTGFRTQKNMGKSIRY